MHFNAFARGPILQNIYSAFFYQNERVFDEHIDQNMFSTMIYLKGEKGTVSSPWPYPKH